MEEGKHESTVDDAVKPDVSVPASPNKRKPIPVGPPSRPVGERKNVSARIPVPAPMPSTKDGDIYYTARIYPWVDFIKVLTHALIGSANEASDIAACRASFIEYLCNTSMMAPLHVDCVDGYHIHVDAVLWILDHMRPRVDLLMLKKQLVLGLVDGLEAIEPNIRAANAVIFGTPYARSLRPTIHMQSSAPSAMPTMLAAAGLFSGLVNGLMKDGDRQ
jgi:hypothetical protein